MSNRMFTLSRRGRTVVCDRFVAAVRRRTKNGTDLVAVDQLATDTKKNRKTIIRWATGETIPPYAKVAEWCPLLDLDPESGEPRP